MFKDIKLHIQQNIKTRLDVQRYEARLNGQRYQVRLDVQKYQAILAARRKSGMQQATMPDVLLNVFDTEKPSRKTSRKVGINDEQCT